MAYVDNAKNPSADGPKGSVVPRFSILTSVFDPETEHLEECLASVDAQTCTDWEHIVVDDASTRHAVRETLDHNLDQRRTVIRRERNGGIAVASNQALAAANGDYVVLLDHDDVLAPDALSVMAATINRLTRSGESGRARVLYSDHDLLRIDGRYASPMYKPTFSPIRLCNHNYITHLVVIERSAIEEVGGWHIGFDGAQDHDLLLRLAEHVGHFEHVPHVLLHWRQSPRSVARAADNKPEAYERGARAVASHLERQGVAAQVATGRYPGVYRIRRRVNGRPLVSVVVPTRGSSGRIWGVERVFVHEAIRSLSADTGNYDLEIVAVIDRDTDSRVERGLRQIVGDALVVVDYDAAFNFSAKINLGVEASSGSFVLLLNDDTELIESGSVEEMLGLAQIPDIGMVGSKLLFGDGRLQHGGHVYNGEISHALLGWRGDHPGPYRLLSVERECSGVTAAAAMLRRDVFDEVGGMDPAYAVNYNDVDFSLKIRSTGRSVVWTPHACWYHFEQQSFEHPIDSGEINMIQQRWGDAVVTDPYYNPNLAPNRCDWLELPLRSGAPPYEELDDGRVSWG